MQNYILWTTQSVAPLHTGNSSYADCQWWVWAATFVQTSQRMPPSDRVTLDWLSGKDEM